MSSIIRAVKDRVNRHRNAEASSDVSWSASPRYKVSHNDNTSDVQKAATSDFISSDFIRHGALVPSDVVVSAESHRNQHDPEGFPTADDHFRHSTAATQAEAAAALPSHLHQFIAPLERNSKSTIETIQALPAADIEAIYAYLKLDSSALAKQKLDKLENAEWYLNEEADNPDESIRSQLAASRDIRLAKAKRFLQEKDDLSNALFGGESLLDPSVTRRIQKLPALASE